MKHTWYRRQILSDLVSPETTGSNEIQGIFTMSGTNVPLPSSRDHRIGKYQTLYAHGSRLCPLPAALRIKYEFE